MSQGSPSMSEAKDALDRLERSVRNYHDSGCLIYLPSGGCDCGLSVDEDALAAVATVRAALAAVEQLERELASVRTWFTLRPWEGGADPSSHGWRPDYSAREREIGYGTYRDPRFLPDALRFQAGSPSGTKEDA